MSRENHSLRKKKKLIFSAILFLFVLITFSISSELILRFRGHRVWKWRSFENEPLHHEPDPIRGWRNKEGKYIFPDYIDRGVVRMTIWPGGLRATGSRRIFRKRRIVIIGGSFTQGHGLSDNETYAWKLQERFPSIEFLNFGTAAYGTYQCLLTLEEYFRNNEGPAPLLVLYGFMPHHKVRNVAPWGWAKHLKTRKRGYAALPYCLIGADGLLERHPPEYYPTLAFRETLILPSFLEEVYMRYKTRGRETQALKVTENLLSEMNELCKKNSSRLLVVLFSPPPNLMEFMRRTGIEYLDCISPDLGKKSMKIPEDGHPNRAMNAIWTDCIEKYISAQLNMGS